MAFFAMHYMNAGLSDPADWLPIWVKSRLVEPWFYVTIVLAIVVFDQRAVNRRLRGAIPIAACIGLYLVFGLLTHLPGGPLGQLIVNASQILSALGGR